MANNLPLEIVLNILSRLSAETVVICKQVCKTWDNNLAIEKTNFAKTHLQQQLNHRRHDHNNLNNGGAAGSKVCLGFIFLLKSENQKPNGHPLYYGEYDENNVDNKPILINHPLIRTKQDSDTKLLVGSCNGLICLAESRKREIRDPIHVCNPITRECLYLPGFNENSQFKSVHTVRSGFGYNPQTNEYKVVRIVYTVYNLGQIQVYTLGSGNGWRNKGIVNSFFDSIYGVFANGALHWLDSSQKKIMAFNLSDENFHVLPSGPFFYPSYYRFLFLRSWGEPLFGVGFGHQCFDVWSLKSTLSSEGIANNTATTSYNEYESWSWCKEFSIAHPSGYSPFTVTKSGLLVLMWHCGGTLGTQTLCYYDPATKSATSLGGVNNCLEVIPHMNSFVSLKDIGETKCKKRKKGVSGVGVKDHHIHI